MDVIEKLTSGHFGVATEVGSAPNQFFVPFSGIGPLVTLLDPMLEISRFGRHVLGQEGHIREKEKGENERAPLAQAKSPSRPPS